MYAQPQWSKWSLPCLLAGLVWVAEASALGGFGALPLWIVGVGLLGSGVSQLLWPGEPAITQTGALAGFAGALIAIPGLFILGPVSGALLAVAALGGAWGSGRMALQLEPQYPGVPVPRPDAKLAARVAVDDLILGWEQFHSIGFPLDGTIERVIDEVERTSELFAREGFLEKPEAYHVMPPDLTDPEIRQQTVAGRSIEVLRFESGYSPAASEPGRERWLGYDACRDGWAYVLRHPGPPRPWLIATNGYRMGFAAIDVRLFERFHQSQTGLGLNVLIPVLPLHGPRRVGWHSGQGFLGIDVVDTLHAEAQAIWDMRRLLSWVRAQDAPAVGAFGLSLGGYTSAVFSSLADGLDCVVAGIPLVDVLRMLIRHGASHQMCYAESVGFDFDRVADVLRVVSPLGLSPRVPQQHRMIFGATADRLVPPDQVYDLWQHWEEPELVWYEGTHVSFGSEPSVWAAVDRSLREAGVAV